MRSASIEPMLNDLRYTLRTLMRSPLFSLVAILSLALGIGANTAIFSLVDHVFLRRLPVADPDRLMLVKDPGPYGNGTAWADDDGHSSFSHPVYLELRDTNTVFSGLVARGNLSFSIGIGSRPAQLFDAEIVSGNYFDVLGVKPAAGRLLTDADDRQPNAHPVAVLSHSYWQRHFGGRADVINSTIRINAFPFTVIGVAAPGFTGTQTGRFPQLFVPMMMKARLTPSDDNLADRTYRWMHLIARLKPGVSPQQATAGLRAALLPSIEKTLTAQPDLPADVRAQARARRPYLSPGGQGRETLRRDSGEALLILLGMTGLVLLVACANVANLLIARGASRSREIAIRLSVGASRFALIRQMLVESMVLGIIGGLAGTLVASWALAILQTLVPGDSRELLAVSLDQRTLFITLGISLGTGLLFGLLPALQSTRSDPADAMKGQASATTLTPAGARFRRLLVASQFALSFVLLVAGGLLARSLAILGQQSPGFEVERLVTFSMDATLSGYTVESARDAYARLRDQLASIPGVRDAGLALLPVLADRGWTGRVRADGCLQADQRGELEVGFNGIDPSFHRLMGLSLTGRGFDTRDRAKSPAVVIVNQAFARACFGNASAVGRTIRLGRRNLPATIVGVVQDARLNSIRQAPTPYVYMPVPQAPGISHANFYLRTALPESAIIGAAQGVVRDFDANLAVLQPRTLREQINETIVNERLSAFLSVVFALLAVTLAGIGLYGVLAFMVTRRTREIGVRLALGADLRSVEWLVLREVLVLAGVGLAIGLPAALALARVMQSLLYGIQPYDPLIFFIATILLLSCAFAAGYWPARRASHVDPMVALRYD